MNDTSEMVGCSTTGLETSEPIEFLTEELRLNRNVFWVITEK
jgi:hypothetical protein